MMDQISPCTQDTISGVFIIKGSSSKLHRVNFGTTTGEPSCTYHDWIQWRIPCKHFFAVFRFFEKWQWDSLPEQYKCQPHISSSVGETKNNTPSCTHTDTVKEDVPYINQTELPTKKVSLFNCNLHVCSYVCIMHFFWFLKAFNNCLPANSTSGDPSNLEGIRVPFI